MYSGLMHKASECHDVLQRRIEKCKAEKSQSLNLTNLLLSEIPEVVSELHWLESLDISGDDNVLDEYYWGSGSEGLSNTINQLPDWILKLKNLKKIYLNNNLIQDISFLQTLTNLEEIYASGNHINEIDALSKLPHLGKVDLVNNKIKKIPTLQSCQWLNISKNDLIGEIEISVLGSIQILLASFNKITGVRGVEQCLELIEVKINNNEISLLPEFSKLPRLKLLDISSNKIEKLDGRYLPSCLEILEVRDNIVNEIINLPLELSTIDLYTNRLEKLPELKTQTNLKWLDLGNNKIVRFAGSELVEGIEQVSIQKNLIESFGDTEFPSSLRYLDLSNNLFASIPIISSIEGVETIILSGNKIAHIEGSWNFENLEIVVIEKNHLKSLEFLGHLPKLSELWLENNEISDISCLVDYCELRLLIVSNNKIEVFPPKLFNLTKLNEFQAHGNKNLYRTIPKGIVEIYEDDEDKYYDSSYIIEDFWRIGYSEFEDLPQRQSGRSPKALLQWLEAISQSPKINKSVRLVFCGNGRVGKSSILDCLQGRPFAEDKESTHAIAIERLEFSDLECWVWDFGGQEIYHSTHRLFMGGDAVYILVWDEETEKTGESIDPIDPNLVHQNFKLHYWVDFIRSESPTSPIIVVQNKTAGNWSFPSEDILPSELNIRFITAFDAKSCKEKDNEQLLFYIQQAAYSLPEYEMTVPEAWWKVQNHLLELKTRHEKPMMTFGEFERLCLDMQVIPKHILVLRKYLDQVSTIHILEKHLGEVIIINDMWFVQPIYKVLERGTPFFNELLLTGRFSKDRFSEAITKESDYSEDLIDLFLLLMQSIGLCFPTKKVKNKPVEYLIPRFVSNELPERAEEFFEGLENETYFIQYVGSLHYHLMQNFIVNTGNKTDFKSIGRRGIFFNLKGGIIAFISANSAMDTITIKVAGHQKERRKWVMDAIRITFGEIAKNYKYLNQIQSQASYDGKSYATLHSIRSQYELHKDKDKGFIEQLRIEGAGFLDGNIDLHKLLWTLEPNKKANFQNLPVVDQNKNEKPKSIFISFAQEDIGVLEKFVDLIGPEISTGNIRVWYDKNIHQRTSWDVQIQSELQSADLFVVIVSTAYLKSVKSYIREKEEPIMIDRWKNEKIPISPLLIDKDCLWESSVIYNATVPFPKKGEAVTEKSQFKSFIHSILMELELKK